MEKNFISYECPHPLRSAMLLPLATILFACMGESGSLNAEEKEVPYTKDFRLEECTFTDEGKNAFFILQPGYQLVLEGEEEGSKIRFVMNVLSETKDFTLPGIGVVTARVVEEKEWKDGKPQEDARSYFAMCKETGDIYDFGDDVKIYNEDGTVSNEGSWSAGEPDGDGIAKPGIFMPGTFLLGARYYQQQGDGLSMERGENMEMGLIVSTEAGTFKDCVKVLETNIIEPGGAPTEKTHCPGIGLVGEDTLTLVKYGFNAQDEKPESTSN